MSDVIIDVGSNKTSRINLGIQGENIVEHVIFNIASWIEEYGEGVAYVYARRSGDLEPYPVALDMDIDAKTATWDVNLVDTAVKGRGSAQLVYVVDEDNEPDFSEDEIKKTKVFATTVQASLVVSSEENPEGYSTWLEVLGGYTARVESAKAAAQAAQTAAETAQGLAEDAQEDAELARDSASASATSASASATSASNSATAAAASEATAASAAASASSDASDAAASATAAAQSAGNANLYQGWAQNYATNAQGYANDANNSKLAASTSAVNSANSALESEGYSVGTQDGEDVPSTSSYYHNNAKYYAESADASSNVASQAASSAATYAGNAASSAIAASASASNAGQSSASASEHAATATNKASEASASATSAAESASDASDSADAAAASAEAAAQSAASLTVDTELDDTSTNPVQNKVITAEITDLKEDINSLSIEMYSKGSNPEWEDAKTDAEKITGAFFHAEGTEVTAASWNYYHLNVNAGEQYFVKGYTSSWARCAVITNSNGTVLETYPAENVTNLVQSHLITIPWDGVNLYVNENISNSLIPFTIFEKNNTPINYGVINSDLKSKVLSNVNDGILINNAQGIKNIEWVDIKNAGNKIEGYFMSAYDAIPQALTGWNYYWFNVKAGDNIKASGYSQGWGRLIIFTDSSLNIVQTFPSENTTGADTFEITVPDNAVKMYINEKYTEQVSMIYKGFVDSISYDTTATDRIGEKVNDNEYIIGTDSFKYRIILEDTESKTFNLSSLKYNDVVFKDVSDDVSPINLVNVRYVGANHGYNFAHNLTIQNHGYLYSDIGKTYNDGVNIWVLIKIINANTIQVVCYDSSVWYKMKTATAPSSVNFGTGTKNVTGSSARQIYPSVKNVSKEVLENSDVFRVSETYDIIDAGTGIENIINNVGNNNNDSIVNLADSAVTIRNIYEFLNNGSMTVYQNLKMLKSNISLDFYGGVQSGAFGSNDYYDVAETNVGYKSSGTTEYFERSAWNDQTKPPILYMQTESQQGTKAFFTGYITENRNNDIYNGGSAGFSYGNTRKMYPYLVNPHSMLSVGKTYNSASLRIPCILNEFSNDISYFGYTKYYEKYVVVIGTNGATNASVSVPETLKNRKCEVYMNDNIEVETIDVIDKIDVIASDRGYAILMLS